MSFVSCWRSHPRELARPERGACKGGHRWLHMFHALSARFRKMRCYTNVVCCGLEIPPMKNDMGLHDDLPHSGPRAVAPHMHDGG